MGGVLYPLLENSSDKLSQIEPGEVTSPEILQGAGAEVISLILKLCDIDCSELFSTN